MQELAFFDRCLARRARSLASHPLHAGVVRSQLSGGAQAPVGPASLARAADHLISPWGQAIAVMPRRASAARILRAAHGVTSADWLGVLADESLSRGTQTAWRLALWRADRTVASTPCAVDEPGPQWLSPVVWARPGHGPIELRELVLQQAVSALWKAGWCLNEAFAPDLH